MDVEKVWSDLQQLPNLIVKINKREHEPLQFLYRLARQILGEEVSAGCTNCHIKAYHKLVSLTKNQLLEMNARKFKLTKGVTIEHPRRGGQFYSESTMTDEIALDFLINHPEGVKYFAEYPKDHNGDLKLFEDAPVVEETPLALEDMNAEQVKEIYLQLFGEKGKGKKDELIAAIEQKYADDETELTQLRADYLEIKGENAPEGLTKDELIAAIEAE